MTADNFVPTKEQLEKLEKLKGDFWQKSRAHLPDVQSNQKELDMEEYSEAAPEPASSGLPNNTPKGYRLSLEDDEARIKAETDALVAEFEERIATANAEYNGLRPPKAEYTDLDNRGDDLVQDTLQDGPPGDGGLQRLEDAHIGERIARDHLQEYVHAKGFGWLKFDGRRWKPVEETIVGEVVRQALIDFYYSEAKGRADTSRLQKISGMLSANRIRSILWICKLRVTTQETFDAHPDLLNVRNGVVDLRDGTLRPHDPNLMLTKVSMVDYVPGATHRDWQQALTALPDDAVDWLQVRFGQGLSGHSVPDDRLVVLKGSGSNGKTTIVDGVREALGTDYAVTLPDKVLLARTGDHPTELMTLRGARLGLMEELPELGHLNVKRLKDLHGTGEMTARYCGKDTVSWKPSHSVFVSTNYLPRVDESDHGTWRRLALVDFPYRYCRTDEKIRTSLDRLGDPNLRERLRRGGGGQHQAVLAWLIAGAVKWYQRGQVMPEDPRSVREATQAWRRTSDLLMRYMDDRLVFDSEAFVASTELFEDFTAWLKANGNMAWSDQTFSARFAEHSEVESHGVVKRMVRQTRPGLSRPPSKLVQGTTGRTLPKQFTGWCGVRFCTDDDLEGNGQ